MGGRSRLRLSRLSCSFLAPAAVARMDSWPAKSFLSVSARTGNMCCSR